MKHLFFFLFLIISCCVGCRQKQASLASASLIAEGQAPSLATDKEGHLHLVYIRGDSIMYAFSTNGGQTFSVPALVGIVGEMGTSHARGPQVAVSGQQVSVIACNKSGNIFSFGKNRDGLWERKAKVNDHDSAAREGLISLSGDGSNLFAVWLDSRDKYTKIYGSASADGGNSWSKNILIYASPDSMVCSCCKPSVAVKGNQVFVMFRNLIGGNRDLYLTQSSDDGRTFNHAEKLGYGSWALNGCPMDGGGLVVDGSGKPETVWQREDTIYRCALGQPEQQIARGRSCSMASSGGKDVYVWTDKGEVISMISQGKKQILGKGSQPIVRTVSDGQFICIWENEKQIHGAILGL